MPTARELLNEYKWRSEFDFLQISITYIHRGAPDDTITITAEEIQQLGRSFFSTTSAEIPYHRIIRIDYKNKPVWIRDENKTIE